MLLGLKLNLLVYLCGLSLVLACHIAPSESPNSLTENVPGIEPQGSPGEIHLPDAPLPALVAGENNIKISESSSVPVRYSNGLPFIPVEGIIADSGFARVQANASLLQLNPAEKERQFQKFLGNIINQMNSVTTVHEVFAAADVGYFSGWISLNEYSKLKDVSGLAVDVLISPRVQSMQRPQIFPDPAIVVPLAHPKFEFGNFSGIERMGVSSFLKMVSAELGEEPTGRRVSVGVADTGVTYAHPALQSQRDGKSRVTYMKDFTNEGAGFVSSKAKFSALKKRQIGEDGQHEPLIEVSVSAEYFAPEAILKMPPGEFSQLPFSVLKDEIFYLPKALVQIIEAPDTPIRIGVISESYFSRNGDKVDLNGNGRTDELFYFFHLPSTDKKSEKVWIDFSGTRRFQLSEPLKDFNQSGDVLEVMSEKVGVSFSEIAIPSQDENIAPQKLARISIVGFDPGNHGSHVIGILGASKTLSNDVSRTLARGVAPEVSLMVNRVCPNSGYCDATKAIIDLAQNGAKIINMSFGNVTFENDGYGIQETIINRLTELYNVLFVVAAGNAGPIRQTVASPSTARHALSVAATATPKMLQRQYNVLGHGGSFDDIGNGDDDFLMFFSSRGPSAAGGFKPNLAAPGSQLSLIHLNTALGSRAGIDINAGTSMAAPAAAGAAALLLDAALAYNEKNPDHPLPTDALTLRRVLLDSARPFNVNSFNPGNGKARKGIYTWIDQGYGMVSLPAAWNLLKKKSLIQLSSGVDFREADGTRKSLQLDYNVRVLRPLGNGKTYDGSVAFQAGSDLGQENRERKFGQGVWLTEDESARLIEVHFTRRLPLKALSSPVIGDLLRQLNTSFETFELETMYYGSSTPWLRVGSPHNVNCDDDAIPENNILTLIGSAAVEAPAEDSQPSLIPFTPSSLFLCLRKNAMSQLTPGDHGAIIRAFRVVGDQRDVVAAFEVPVYLTIPHHSTEFQAKFLVENKIRSYSVDRNYVRIPEGVSAFQIAFELPEQLKEFDVPCSGLKLMIKNGSHSSTDSSVVKPQWIDLQNCDLMGSPTSKSRAFKFSELNPSAGIWEIHVFGLGQFPVSQYKLEIDYASFVGVESLKLTPETVSAGEFQLGIRESTFDVRPDVSKSTLNLNSLVRTTKHKISMNDDFIIVPAASGGMARSYSSGLGAVSVSTATDVPGLDIAVFIDECADAELKNCRFLTGFANNAENQATYLPRPGKYYSIRVRPFEVPRGSAVFSVIERIRASYQDDGYLEVLSSTDKRKLYRISYSFEPEKSWLLQNELFKSGQYEILGECQLSNSDSQVLVNMPVHVRAR